MVSTGMKCVKYLLFIFNLIFYFAGLILIVAGALAQTIFSGYLVFFGSGLNGAAVLLIVVGIIVFTVGFFGCCGAYKENHCMIMAFSVLLAIVFVLEIAAAIAARIMQNQLESLLQKGMTESLAKYPEGKTQDVWDNTQQAMKCCGAGNFTDWEMNSYFANISSVPDSCCVQRTEACGGGALNDPDPAKIFEKGCTDVVFMNINHYIYIILGVALALAAIQIVGIIIACCLASAIRKDYTPM